MSKKKMGRRQFLQTAVAAGAGSVLGAGLVGSQVATALAADKPTEMVSAVPAAQAATEINAVGIFPLTGAIAGDGIEMRNGTVMAIDEINESLGGLLGKKIKYIEVDDVDSTGDQVTTAFRRAIDVEKADVIFSGYHLNSSPEFDICAEAGVLYYNNNTQKAWTDRYSANPDKYWSIFQTDPNEEWYGGGFALFLDQLVQSGQYKPAKKTAYVLHGDEVYGAMIGATFVDQATKLGWEIVGNQAFTVGNVSDWGPLLSPVRDNPPAVLFTSDYNPADNANMIKQFVANPIPTVIYQHYGPSVPEYMDLAGEAANGVIWATVLGYLPDAIGQDWTARYEKKFNAKPGWANAPGDYDSVWVWAKAVGLAGDHKDYKKVAKVTESLIHRGVTGGISFVNHAGVCYPWQKNDPSLGQSHIVVQIQNKEYKVIFPDPYTDGKFQMPPWVQA